MNCSNIKAPARIHQSKKMSHTHSHSVLLRTLKMRILKSQDLSEQWIDHQKELRKAILWHDWPFLSKSAFYGMKSEAINRHAWNVHAAIEIYCSFEYASQPAVFILISFHIYVWLLHKCFELSMFSWDRVTCHDQGVPPYLKDSTTSPSKCAFIIAWIVADVACRTWDRASAYKRHGTSGIVTETWWFMSYHSMFEVRSTKKERRVLSRKKSLWLSQSSSIVMKTVPCHFPGYSSANLVVQNQA